MERIISIIIFSLSHYFARSSFSRAGWVRRGGPGRTVAGLGRPASITSSLVPGWARLTGRLAMARPEPRAGL